MNFIKKIFVLLIYMSVTFIVFAQENENYERHLEKAKEYENHKKWIYALSEYWDAMNSEDTGNVNEAFSSILNLKDAIENGNPGYGNYGEFEYYDEWINLMIDYEHYWTEHFPYFFTYSINKISIDRETRSAEYSIKLNLNITPKCRFLSEIVYNGLNKANTEYWDKELVDLWPNVSVYNFLKDKNGYFIDGTALISNLQFSQYRMPAAFAYLGLYRNKNEFEKLFWSDRTISHVVLEFARNTFLPYKVSFNIKNVDTGSILHTTDLSVLYSEQQSVLDVSYRSIRDIKPEFTIKVSQDVMSLIDSGKVEVTIKEIDLLYGIISKEFLKDNFETDLIGKWATGLSTKIIDIEDVSNDISSQISKVLKEKNNIDDSIKYYKERFYDSKQNGQYDLALEYIGKWNENACALFEWNKKYSVQEEIQKSEKELNNISEKKEMIKKEAEKLKKKKTLQSFFSF